ncbi:Heterokaryon incompatibility protein 6- OR allele [Apiospora marii]|uniref:Heterokaryon incompatibility protein 6- OR allele n=1 Tax=Apiospora marii TaxID=335849 RepID=UPI00312EB2B8
MAQPVSDDGKSHASQLYQPLDRKRQETRILLITSTDPIQFDFEYASMLDEQVEGFDAISWCWGDTGAMEAKNITVKGRNLAVSESAHDVLLELCIAQKKRRVWIDAVCINQADMDERSQQVAMMRSIYERSAMTLVWLGRDNGTAQKSMQMIMEVANWRQIRFGNAQRYGEFWDESTADPFPPNIDWDAVGAFFSAAWFTRLWVIQEVVLSTHVHVFWGKYQMCWRHLVQTTHYITHSVSDENLEPGSRVGLSNTVMIGKIQDEKSHPLFVLVSNPRLGATDPKDRVFALYGLLKEDLLDETQVALRKSFSPDYSLPLVEIDTNATKAAMCSAAGLYLLLQAQCLVPRHGWDHSDTGFPSWVPRYHFVQDAARGSYKPLSSLIERYSKHDVMKVDTDTPQNILRIAGVVVDTVSGVCEQLPPPISDRSPITSRPCFGGTVLRIISQLWDAALAANPHVHRTELAGSLRTTLQMRAEHPNKQPIARDCNDDYRYAFQSLVAKFWPTEGNVPTESGVLLEDEPADFDDADLDNEYASDEDLEPPGQSPAFPRLASQDEGEDRSLDLFWDRIRTRHVNRRFFVTSGGRMGSAAPRSQAGDKICILSGLTVPIVLRQVDGSDWVLIGDAYLSGLVKTQTYSYDHLLGRLGNPDQDKDVDNAGAREQWFNLK